MFKNTNKEERKTFKEVLAENKGKIIAGATIVTRDIATYKIAGLRPGTNVRVKALIEDYDLMYRGNLKIQVQEIEAR